MARKRKTDPAKNSITLNGKSYDLELNFAAIADIHEATGIDLMALTEEQGSQLLSGRNAQQVVWALIGGPDSGLTAREVGKAMTIRDLQQYVDPILKEFSVGEDADEGNAVSVDDIDTN